MKKEYIKSKGIDEKTYLDNYDITSYEQPSVTVDMLLMTISDEEIDNYRKLPRKSLKVLLIKRSEHPFKGKWALPGGFVKINESIEEAAYRELAEETGISNVYLEQLYTYGEVNRDPRGRIISTAYMTLADVDTIQLQAGTDAEDARWFELHIEILSTEKEETDNGFDDITVVELTLTNEETQLASQIKLIKRVCGKNITYDRTVLSNDGLSFDHGKIIQYGLERLRNKIDYSDIVFHLLPKKFTLTELQRTYEVILDKSLVKANFRRKTKKYVVETDLYTSDGGHRPSKLYEFNPDWENINL